MKIYLAGGVHGNLNPLWRIVCKSLQNGRTFDMALEDGMKVFLAGVNGRHQMLEGLYAGVSGGRELSSSDSACDEGERGMQLFLAGVAPWRSGGGYDKIIREHKPYILESFYYVDADTERLLPYYGDFLLDSGAFTFMGGFDFVNNAGNVNFDDYIERYAHFINKNKVDKFFELDVDVCVGYDKVKEFRSRLEKLTNKQPIPVWHSTRGKEEFIRSCDEYPYVALGGIVGGEWSAKAEKFIPWFIQEAHKRKAKIHGLGYTKLKKLREYHFDSVDSTTWTIGNRFGSLFYFDGQTIVQRPAPKGYKIGKPREAALHNYIEWIKFQKWADTHL